MADPIRILLVNPDDAKYLALAEELTTHLEPLRERGLLTIASEQSTPIGDDIDAARRRNIAEADVVAVLVGPATPGKCRDTIAQVLQRKAREGDRLAVLPILLFPGGYEDTPLAAMNLRPLPLSKVPVNTQHDRDTVWVEIVKALKGVSEKLQAKKAAHSSRSAPTTNSQTSIGVGSVQAPTNAWLRKALREVLRTDSEFTAFCLDYFPTTHILFANGMDRLQKENLLLETTKPNALWAALREGYPDMCQTLDPAT
ncbi:MAG: hypothetical protein JNJ46_22115 [Myxococcales bacterium]|nr:hypothetical protein [Myxococcales bacterium]